MQNPNFLNLLIRRFSKIYSSFQKDKVYSGIDFFVYNKEEKIFMKITTTEFKIKKITYNKG